MVPLHCAASSGSSQPTFALPGTVAPFLSRCCCSCRQCIRLGKYPTPFPPSLSILLRSVGRFSVAHPPALSDSTESQHNHSQVVGLSPRPPCTLTSWRTFPGKSFTQPLESSPAFGRLLPRTDLVFRPHPPPAGGVPCRDYPRTIAGFGGKGWAKQSLVFVRGNCGTHHKLGHSYKHTTRASMFIPQVPSSESAKLGGNTCCVAERGDGFSGGAEGSGIKGLDPLLASARMLVSPRCSPPTSVFFPLFLLERLGKLGLPLERRDKIFPPPRERYTDDNGEWVNG